jgi:ADP-ribosylglycohydrolase
MPEGAVYQDEVNQHLRPLDHEPLTRSHCGGSGYVVDSLRSARWACQAEDYRAVMHRAIGLGHDTDTTACIAGGIAGLRCGLTQLSTALVQGLRGQTEWLAPLQQQLLCYWRDQ